MVIIKRFHRKRCLYRGGLVNKTPHFPRYWTHQLCCNGVLLFLSIGLIHCEDVEDDAHTALRESFSLTYHSRICPHIGTYRITLREILFLIARKVIGIVRAAAY